MKKSEIKEALFSAFEDRCREYGELRRSLEEQLKQRRSELARMYGVTAVEHLDTSLARKAATKVNDAKSGDGDGSARRGPRRQIHRETSARQLFLRHAEQTVETLLERSESFTGKDVHEYMTGELQVSGEEFTPKNATYYMGQHFQDFGLRCELRQVVAGQGRKVNIYSASDGSGVGDDDSTFTEILLAKVVSTDGETTAVKLKSELGEHAADKSLSNIGAVLCRLVGQGKIRKVRKGVYRGR